VLGSLPKRNSKKSQQVRFGHSVVSKVSKYLVSDHYSMSNGFGRYNRDFENIISLFSIEIDIIKIHLENN
jgi:hypothetical protein